jgi:hypothetical protein
MMAVDSTTRDSRSSRVGHWVAELVLVFLGVYTAFWLSNYQQDRQNAKRRDQLLAQLELETNQQIEGCKREAVKNETRLTELRRALDAGEMPHLGPITIETDYSATDTATLLQAGGFDLLDIKTISALRRADRTFRSGLNRVEHIQKLSDEMIFPNLDQETSFFYDPATKKLRNRFAAYPLALQSIADFLHDVQKAHEELLTQIRAERQRH